ncbi:MAG: TrmH family RNA methyltransferase [Pseudomonadota bacterium]
MRLAAFQPDNPYNLGAMIRLCACFGVPLDVIEPCGFPFSMRAVRQTALDYGAQAILVRHENWRYFRARQAGRVVALTTRAETPLWAHRFADEDTILMGRESAGLPEEIHAAVEIRLAIPMPGGTRSLNVAMAAAIALGEAMRQTAAAAS